MHLHLLSVFRNASSLGFRLQIVVHFLPPSLSSFFSFLSGILRSIHRPGSIRRDGEPACFLRDRGNHRHDRAVNSLWRCSCFFSKSFDQMPRLSSFLQSLQQASIPIPDLEIVFFSLSATLQFQSLAASCPYFTASKEVDPEFTWKEVLFFPPYFIHHRNVFSRSPKPKLANSPFSNSSNSSLARLRKDRGAFKSHF